MATPCYYRGCLAHFTNIGPGPPSRFLPHGVSAYSTNIGPVRLSPPCYWSPVHNDLEHAGRSPPKPWLSFRGWPFCLLKEGLDRLTKPSLILGKEILESDRATMVEHNEARVALDIPPRRDRTGTILLRFRHPTSISR